ncbi:unnamed protein product [Rotaria socialis]
MKLAIMLTIKILFYLDENIKLSTNSIKSIFTSIGVIFPIYCSNSDAKIKTTIIHSFNILSEVVSKYLGTYEATSLL